MFGTSHFDSKGGLRLLCNFLRVLPIVENPKTRYNFDGSQEDRVSHRIPISIGYSAMSNPPNYIQSKH